jgi:hypothetical protein
MVSAGREIMLPALLQHRVVVLCTDIHSLCCWCLCLAGGRSSLRRLRRRHAADQALVFPVPNSPK